MHVTLKDPSKNMELFHEMRVKGVSVFVNMRGEPVYNLPAYIYKRPSWISDSAPLFGIPTELSHGQLALCLEEDKCFPNPDTVVAHIVCGTEGEPLQFLRTREPDITARFSRRQDTVLITAEQSISWGSSESYTIENVGVRADGGIVWIERQLIWHGNLQNLYSSPEIYRSALEEASLKVNCPDCAHAHYVLPPDTYFDQFQIPSFPEPISLHPNGHISVLSRI